MSRLTYRNNLGQSFLENGADAIWQKCEAYNVLSNAIEKLAHYEDLEEQGRLIEREYATIVSESGICSKCGESYMDVADADAFQSGYIPNFCPWCGAIFVSEAKLAELKGE